MFMPVPSPTEMARWDAAAIALGVPEAVLMENAAREAFAVLRRRYGSLRGARVLLVMGGGNNGGDAACLARHLLDAGALPVVAHTKPLLSGTGAARRYALLARKLGVSFVSLSGPGAAARLAAQTALPYDVIVDGLLGTGFAGNLREKEAGLVAWINALAHRCFVLALDVPSGLNAATGKACPDAVRARVTVTFQAAKPGLIVPEAAPFTGEVEVRHIGMPAQVMEKHPASFRLWSCPAVGSPVLEGASPASAAFLSGNDPADPVIITTTPGLPLSFPVSPAFSGPAHKGDAGRVLIIGGSAGMSGAPRLAAWGALRGGAGLIVVAAPDSAIPHVRQELPEVVTVGLPLPVDRTSGSSVSSGLSRSVVPSGQSALSTKKTDAAIPTVREWATEHVALLVPHLASSRAVVIGPGMGRGNGAEDFLEALLMLSARPALVLDADALFALRARPALFSLLKESDVLTPHPGEAATLLGWSGQAVQADRFAALSALQALAPAVWVLKGAGALISAPGAPACICPWNVPQLAVAGSGDVLAGLVGAFLAASPSLLGTDAGSGFPAGSATDFAGRSSAAACLAVHLHALAGLSLARRFPLRGNSPRDVADALPAVRPLLGEI